MDIGSVRSSHGRSNALHEGTDKGLSLYATACLLDNVKQPTSLFLSRYGLHRKEAVISNCFTIVVFITTFFVRPFSLLPLPWQSDVHKTLAGVRESLNAVDVLQGMVLRMEQQQQEQRLQLQGIMQVLHHLAKKKHKRKKKGGKEAEGEATGDARHHKTDEESEEAQEKEGGKVKKKKKTRRKPVKVASLRGSPSFDLLPGVHDGGDE